MSIACGIVLAGGAYPVIFAAGCLVFFAIQAAQLLLASGGAGGNSVVGELMAEGALFAAATATIGAVIGLIWTAVATLVMLPLMYLLVASLRLRVSLVWLGAFFGGLVGSVAVLPLMTADLQFDLHRWLESSIALLIGPGLTTVLGQIGGAWGGHRAVQHNEWYERAITIAEVGGWPPTDPVSNGAAEAKPLTIVHFTTRHLLWVAVWLSLLLSVIRLSGISFTFALPLILGWLVYQSVTLWIGAQLASRLWPWWNTWRQSRST